ncbi:MAG: lipopolysaccharide biosynthesis protein, partial [Betaproteobacteria bacterium]|nr:lipopolysaccharide biosynthesis protein [Betaproteobacteria bacterium]
PEDEINLLDLLLVVAKHNRFILKLTGGAAILAVIVSLLMPNIYTGKTVILPPQQSSSSAASMLLGQLGGLAGAAGGALGIKNPSDLYVGMLKSRTVADALIQRFKLMELYEAKTMAAARTALEGATVVTAGKDGFIAIEYSDKDTKLAAAIANAYVEELDRLSQSLAVTEAAQRRLFFEKQLKGVHEGLDRAELAMKEMQEKTGVIQLEGQSGAILSAEAGLRAQIAAKEIELSAMRTFATEQNPDYLRTEQMIASLRGQLSKLERGNQIGDGEMTSKGKIPAMAVEYIHKMRDLRYYEKLFDFMTQQVVAAKIDEAKDTAIIQVVDKALPPEKKSKPKRALIVLLTTAVAFFLGIFWAFFKEAAERARQDPEQAERISLLRRYFRQGRA